ncbi:uncharacterized protein LOC117101535 [Anneissia japonica]|uniref:uncharacterized protein LOC117101535 n=1 Tax=Anneissia japonica TaxID=1529436 RepID=UPI0014256A7D|nr:uncharacterized protein LOC117101535 [Anneissia japonica]
MFFNLSRHFSIDNFVPMMRESILRVIVMLVIPVTVCSSDLAVFIDSRGEIFYGYVDTDNAFIMKPMHQEVHGCIAVAFHKHSQSFYWSTWDTTNGLCWMNINSRAVSCRSSEYVIEEMVLDDINRVLYILEDGAIKKAVIYQSGVEYIGLFESESFVSHLDIEAESHILYYVIMDISNIVQRLVRYDLDSNQRTTLCSIGLEAFPIIINGKQAVQ